MSAPTPEPSRAGPAMRVAPSLLNVPDHGRDSRAPVFLMSVNPVFGGRVSGDSALPGIEGARKRIARMRRGIGLEADGLKADNRRRAA